MVQAEANGCDLGLECDWIKTDSGSNIVVIEEITAIWCDICAITDPTIQDFTNQRHQEVARIAYHPDDGLDYLGNRLSTHQMWDLGENPTEAEFPTIWMDGGNKASGATTEDQLQRQYLKAAGQRTSEDTIQVEYFNHCSSWSCGSQYRLEFITTVAGDNSEQITLVLTENGVGIDNPESYNGVAHHDDVATAGVIVNSYNGTIIFAEPIDAWEVIQGEINDNVSNLQILYNYSLESTLEEDEMIKQKSLVAYSKNSAGEIIAAQHIKPANTINDNGKNPMIIVSGIALIGILLATPALNKLKEDKTTNVIKPGAESEE
tara:strand:- start:263 stop:1219 length:957 start_codon:yes stop_codon:yes gene_type:complete